MLSDRYIVRRKLLKIALLGYMRFRATVRNGGHINSEINFFAGILSQVITWRHERLIKLDFNSKHKYGQNKF